MSFCFAFRSTDARLLVPAVAPFESVLRLEDSADFGWGLGYYQSGQALLKKQPRGGGELDFTELAQNMRTNLLLGHSPLTKAVGPHATENTQPFRFRNWVFSHCGEVPRLEEIKADLLASVPDFIRRNIRGSSDSEHLFHLFLAFLNDTGQLDAPRIGGDVIGRVLSSTITYLDRLLGKPTDHCCVVTNGNILVGTHRGIPLKVTRHSSYRNAARTADDKPINFPHLKAVLLVGGVVPDAPGWEDVRENAAVIIDSELNLEYWMPTQEA